MSRVLREGDVVSRTPTPASPTIQRLLGHLAAKGLDWVPQPRGFNEEGRELVTFLQGQVVQEIPPWFWSERVLVTAARRLREFHDATAEFDASGCAWNLEPREPQEVIIHNDFAPYNTLFVEGEFTGLIDFDLCCPGPRIWDIAYTAYRFVPIMPMAPDRPEETWAMSPFDWDQICRRLDLFLSAYAGVDDASVFPSQQVMETAILKLEAMEAWILSWLVEHPNPGLEGNLRTYRYHADWLRRINLQTRPLGRPESSPPGP